MILRHWSGNPLPKVLENKEQRNESWKRKPNGFWLSDENSDMSWKKWCDNECFREDQFGYWADFQVDMSDILHLKNKKDILLFTETYRMKPDDTLSIDWVIVAQNYKGIIITPYVWECRFDKNCDWYYPWDCASGCFWDVSCLSLIKKGKPHAKGKGH